MQKLMLVLSLAALAACGDGGRGNSSVAVPEIIHNPGLPPAPPKPKAVPFDASATSLGENFTGHNCREVAAALRGKNVLKDQYESTKEFKARIEKLKESSLYDDVKLGSQIVFVYQKGGYSTYDADRGVLNFDASYIGYNVSLGESHPMLTAFKESKNERNYVGKNAFGATADVNYQEEEVCVVTMANLPFEGLKKSHFKIQASPERARGLSGNIATAYVGVLMPPFIKEYREYQRPEISRPYEINTTGEDIRFRLHQVLVFNRTTGEILAKRAFK